MNARAATLAILAVSLPLDIVGGGAVCHAHHISRNLRLIKYLPIEASTRDIWQTDTRAFVALAPLGGLEYLAVVDFADARNPVLTFHGATALGAEDVETSSQYVWQGIDPPPGLVRWIRSDLSGPVIYNNLPAGPCAPAESIGDCHQISVLEPYLLCASKGENRLHVLEIPADPASDPLAIACWDPPSAFGCYASIFDMHDARMWTDAGGRKLIAVAGLSTGLTILHFVESPTPTLTPIFHACYDGYENGPATFTHSVWVSDDGKLLFTSDELNGHRILAWDISTLNLCPPAQLNCGPIPSTECTCAKVVGSFKVTPPGDYEPVPHNLFAQGDLLYAAYYTEGVRILDVTKPEELADSEVAFFDTYVGPPNDQPGGQNQIGAWGVSPRGPFVFAGDQGSGLYILEPFPSFLPRPVVDEGLFLLLRPSWASADLDRDGTLDVVTAGTGVAPGLAVYLNQGDSRFERGGAVPTCPSSGFWEGSDVLAVGAGTFDAADVPDLVVAFTCLGCVPGPPPLTLQVLLGDGAGGFTCGWSLPLFSCTDAELVTGQLVGTPSQDFAIAACSDVRAFAGDGTGLGFTQQWSVTETASVPDITAVDYSGDGLLDLAYPLGANSVRVRRNNAGADFNPICRTLSGVQFSTPRSIAASDLDADGKPDLVVGNQGSSSVTVVRSGGCSPAPGEQILSIPLGQWQTDVAVGHFNYQDTYRDVAVAAASKTVLLMQKPPASCPFGQTLCFEPPRLFTGGGQGILAADFNRDRKDDVVTSIASDLLYLHGLGDGTLRDAKETLAQESGQPIAMASGDFDRDGKLDAVVVRAGGTDKVRLYRGDGTGGFDTTPVLTCTALSMPTPADVVAADLTGDGCLDLGVVDVSTSNAMVCPGDCLGGFSTPVVFPSGVTAPAGIAAAPLRSLVPIVDLVIAGSSQVAVRHGSGGGAFNPPALYPVGAGALDVAIGELDAGTSRDIAVACRDSRQVYVLLNIGGTGTFPPNPPGYSTDGTGPQSPTAVALVDLEPDGDFDVVTGNLAAAVSVLANNGTGGLGAATVVAVGAEPLSGNPFSPPLKRTVSALDVDSDSWSEVVVKNPRTVALLTRGPSTPLTATAPLLFHARKGEAVAAGDFDEDLSPDLLTGELDVLSNRGGYYPIGECRDSEEEPIAIGAVDFVGPGGALDGHLDLVTLNRRSNVLRQYQGDGKASFSPVQLPLPLSADNPVAMDGASLPGLALLVIADDVGRKLWKTSSTGGGFAPPTDFDVATFRPSLVVLADFDGIGSTPNDVATVGVEDLTMKTQLRVYYDVDQSQPSGSFFFDLEIDPATNLVPQGLAVGQLDADTDLDIALAVDLSGGGDTLKVFLNNPALRTFSPPYDNPLGGGDLMPRAVAVTDLTNDTIPEIAVASDGCPSDLRVFRRDGTTPGKHDLVRTVNVSPHPFAMKTGNLDARLIPDLYLLHDDQSEHPGTSILTAIPGRGSDDFYVDGFGSWLVLGSFDGPSLAVGDFTTDPSAQAVRVDGIAVANAGRHNFCVIQLR